MGLSVELVQNEDSRETKSGIASTPQPRWAQTPLWEDGATLQRLLFVAEENYGIL